jgi:hypothetical protein
MFCLKFSSFLDREISQNFEFIGIQILAQPCAAVTLSLPCQFPHDSVSINAT